MKVTYLEVYPIREPKGKLRAYARVLLDDQLYLTGLRLYDGSDGLFVSYPNDPSYTGESYRQIFYPVKTELRADIENAVIEEYLAIQNNPNRK